MRERFHVIQGVVVDHGDVALIIQDASVDDDRFLAFQMQCSIRKS